MTTRKKYLIQKHGLLFIVMKRVPSNNCFPEYEEDSRWEDEAKAIKHRDILNGDKNDN